MRPLADLPGAIELPPIVEGVRLWCASLDDGDELAAFPAASLSADEAARAAAYADPRRRARFARARGLLRHLLAEVTGTAPERIELAYNRDGKPSLAQGAAPHFSVSHARDVALIAIGDTRRVGVDVEWTEGSRPFERVAAHFFSPAEREALGRVAPGERRRAFHRTWVRKEAYLKGRGEGISQWIHLTDLSEPPPEGAQDGGDVAARDQDLWCVRDIEGVPGGFVAALAVEREGRR